MSRASRLLRLAHLLSGRRRWRVPDLARELEVSRRTVYRDLNELSASGIPVFKDGSGYRLLDGASLPPLHLTGLERATILLALDNPALGRHQGLRDRIDTLRGKLRAGSTAMEETPLGLRLASIDRSGAIDEDVAGTLDTAVRDSHAVGILYRSLSGGEERWRGLDPYHVFHRAEAWYVVGRCHVHDEPRTFRLDRIDGIRLGDETFTPPEGFALDDYLEHSWGVYRGDETREVVILFDASLAPLIENARHHPDERQRQLPSGKIEYRVAVSHLGAIARWVVGFGGKARAVEPPELREAVDAMATEVLDAQEPGAQGPLGEGDPG